MFAEMVEGLNVLIVMLSSQVDWRNTKMRILSSVGNCSEHLMTLLMKDSTGNALINERS